MGWTARRKEKSKRRPCREARQGREINLRALGNGREDDNGRSRSHVGAGSGSACQNTAQAVMVRTMLAGNARTRSILRAIIGADSVREGKGRGRRGCREEGLQHKCIEREHADRSALCKRSLPKSSHVRAYAGLFAPRCRQMFSGRLLTGIYSVAPASRQVSEYRPFGSPNVALMKGLQKPDS